MTTETVKLCQHCGNPFEARKGERRNKFKIRKFCSQPCYTNVRRINVALKTQPKPCNGCGKMMSPRLGEISTHFIRRKHCDRICAGQAKSNDAKHPRCQHCGAKILLNPHQTKKHPNRPRKFCRMRCFYDHRRRTDYEIKHCLHCGKLLERRPDERSTNYRRREHCDKSCMAFARPKYQPKHCLQCGKLLERRRDERSTNYRRRQHCNRVCVEFARPKHHGARKRPRKIDNTKLKVALTADDIARWEHWRREKAA